MLLLFSGQKSPSIAWLTPVINVVSSSIIASPGAMVARPGAAPVAGWFARSEQAVIASVAQAADAAKVYSSGPNVASVAWHRGFEQFTSAPRIESPGAFGQFIPAVGVSGVAFLRQVDNPASPSRIEPPAESYIAPLTVTVGIAGISWRKPFDNPLSPQRIESPAAFTLPASVTVGISGLAWQRPFEQFVAPARIEPHAEAYVAPQSVTVGVSGIAWRVAVENRVNPPAIQTADYWWDARAFVPVSGMAWNRQVEQPLNPPSPQPSDLAWRLTFPGQPVGVAGMAWWRPVEQFTVAPRVESPGAFGRFVPAVGVAGLSWRAAVENILSPAIIASPGSYPPAIAPSLGMAWFAAFADMRQPPRPADLWGAVPFAPAPALSFAWARPFESLVTAPTPQAPDLARAMALAPFVGAPWLRPFDGGAMAGPAQADGGRLGSFIRPPVAGISGIAWWGQVDNPINHPVAHDQYSWLPIVGVFFAKFPGFATPGNRAWSYALPHNILAWAAAPKNASPGASGTNKEAGGAQSSNVAAGNAKASNIQ